MVFTGIHIKRHLRQVSHYSGYELKVKSQDLYSIIGNNKVGVLTILLNFRRLLSLGKLSRGSGVRF